MGADARALSVREVGYGGLEAELERLVALALA
jgi:hypothetical protein